MKKMRKPKAAAARRARILPDGACPVCGTEMVERRGTLRLPVNSEEIAVPSAAHLHCPKCGEVVLRFQDSKRLGETGEHRVLTRARGVRSWPLACRNYLGGRIYSMVGGAVDVGTRSPEARRCWRVPARLELPKRELALLSQECSRSPAAWNFSATSALAAPPRTAN